MPQFLLSPEDIQGKRFTLTGPEAFHVTRVRRAKEGEAIELFDGQGGRYLGVIRRIRKDGAVEGEITGKVHAAARALQVTLNLYLSLLKSSHWEFALEKCTELGVSAFIPLITPRTVVKLRELTGSKESRWNKILTSAAKQCRRPDIPRIRPPMHYRDAIAQACKTGPTLVAWEKRSAASIYAGLREVLEGERRKERSVVINLFIGPEGGFSEEEIELAEYEGAALVSLGPNTLRAETAAASASAIILYELGVL